MTAYRRVVSPHNLQVLSLVSQQQIRRFDLDQDAALFVLQLAHVKWGSSVMLPSNNP